MNLCVYCKKRKGKRNCPALRGMICSQCCGEKRIKFIPCPETCPVLKEHHSYTMERKGEKFALEWLREFEGLRDESFRIFSAIEWNLYSYLIDSPVSLDIEIFSGLEYVRRKFSPLTFPGEIKNILGEMMFNFLEMAIQEGHINEDDIPEVLDKVINFVKKYKGDNIRSNEFVKGFMGYMEKFQPERAKKIRESKGSKIIEV